MTLINMPLRPDATVHERFRALDSARDMTLTRARLYTSYTMPRLLEETNTYSAPGQEDEELPELFWSRPGRNTVQLANKLTNSIFPANGAPFFNFLPQMAEINSAIQAAAGADAPVPDIDGLLRKLANLEAEILRDLQSSNFRQILYESIEKIIILPDDLIYLDDRMRFRTYRLDQFVIRRGMDGKIMEIITRDWVEEDFLPDNLRSIQKKPNSTAHDRHEPLYTRIMRDRNTDDWNVTREFRETAYEKAKYKADALPYFHMRWNSSTGEDYGTSLVEQNFGLIRSGEATAKALVEGLAAGSSGYMAINPVGMTTIDDVEGKPNWSWISAREEDITAIQPDTSQTVQTCLATLEILSSDLDSAFLSNASTRLQGERVTAFQVDRLVNEQDEALSGVLTHIANQVQRPVVLRLLHLKMKTDPTLRPIKELMDRGLIELKISTGLDALGRQLDALRLQAVMQTIVGSQLPEALEKFNAENWAEDVIRSSGLDADRYARTSQELQQRREAAAQQQVAAQAAQQAIASTGKIAEQQATL